MCGVFGFVLGEGEVATRAELQEFVAAALGQSYARGKEASGLAIRSHDRIALFKEALSSKKLLTFPPFRTWLKEELDRLAGPNDRISGPVTIIGHARLMTNGLQGINENNQPVSTGDTVAIHNGIIVNDAELTERHQDIVRQADVDSEIIPLLIDKYVLNGLNPAEALKAIFDEATGQIATVVIRADRPGLITGTNFGSLYVYDAEDGPAFLCMSEVQFLEGARKNSMLLQRLFAGASPIRLTARKGYLVNGQGRAEPLTFEDGDSSLQAPLISASLSNERARLYDHQAMAAERRRHLKRCTRCVLPETVPGIGFDDQGVCSYCRSHTPYQPKGEEALLEALAPYRRKDGKPEVIMGLSGGRDSSFGVHYVKQKLGIDVVAYTYDWALVTDIARRNISRICSKLGLEHILVSADIKQKRDYIRKNINAWLRQPELGMVPLFMAGDKLYFYYYDRVKKNLGLDIAISCGNRFEKTDFKSGFCGVFNKGFGEGRSWRPYDISVAKKLKYLRYFAWRMSANPGYWNASLLDNAKGFYASYVMKHNFLWLFDYIPWEEDVIEATLAHEFDWETAEDTKSTWRIGDGTASFYNYIYLTAAGFSEHDTFRSNQIREGVMTRERALELVQRDNEPRYESILEYSHLIGFDFDRALAVISQMPKRY
ncbi:MAG: hypothetical protein R3F54_21740 [Alphaproteobacteria bacterium]